MNKTSHQDKIAPFLSVIIPCYNEEKLIEDTLDTVTAELFSRQVLDGFSFDVENLFITRKLGYSIKEIPVRWINRIESKVNPVTS